MINMPNRLLRLNEFLLPDRICHGPMAPFVFCRFFMDGINSILIKCAEPMALTCWSYIRMVLYWSSEF